MSADDSTEVTVTRGTNLCVVTARSDLRYLIEEASALEETSTDAHLAQHHDAIERAMELIRDLRDVSAETPPMRGGAVETWVKRHRDRYDFTGGQFDRAQYEAIDHMLDDLRDRSDIGASWSAKLDDTDGYPVVVDTSPDPEGAEAAQLAPQSDTAGEAKQ